MKELKLLPKEFEGRGEVKGWRFKQIMSNSNAYLYERSHPDCTDVFYYEVFIRKVFKPENREMYPKGESFAKWAWCFRNIEDALERFEQIS